MPFLPQVKTLTLKPDIYLFGKNPSSGWPYFGASAEYNGGDLEIREKTDIEEINVINLNQKQCCDGPNRKLEEILTSSVFKSFGIGSI